MHRRIKSEHFKCKDPLRSKVISRIHEIADYLSPGSHPVGLVKHLAVRLNIRRKRGILDKASSLTVLCRKRTVKRQIGIVCSKYIVRMKTVQ